MIAYSLMTAKASGIFNKIMVASDSDEICSIASYYGADEIFKRNTDDASSTSLDIDWLSNLYKSGKIQESYFAIIRPTSPLRSVELIKDCVTNFLLNDYDSLRTVKLVSEHPGKMWRIDKSQELFPYLKQDFNTPASHAKQYQSLETLYVQTSVFEIAKTSVIPDTNSREGNSILGYITRGVDSLSIDTLDDLNYLNYICSISPELLYKIQIPSYFRKNCD